MKRSEFMVDGNPLTNLPHWWVTDAQKMHGPTSVTMARVTLPGVHGELPIPRSHTVGAGSWTVNMSIAADSYTELYTKKAALEAILIPPHRLVTITERLWVPGREGAQIYTDISAEGMLTSSNIDTPWNSPDDGMDVEYTFDIPSGRWSGAEQTSTITGPGTYNLLPENGGAEYSSAPQYDTTITLETTGPVDFSIHNPYVGGCYVGYQDPNNPGGRRITIRTIDSSATYAASPRPIICSNHVHASDLAFYIPAEGDVRITDWKGVSKATITTRKAYY